MELVVSDTSAGPGLSRLCISLPHLKKSVAFFETDTTAPVRGFRPICESRILTEKGGQAVDFRLETKDGKVSLKAKVVK